MTLKRLMILLGILVLVAGVGIMWLWHVAYTPEGRARIIIVQLKGDTTSTRGWLLQHHLARPGFAEPPKDSPLRAQLGIDFAQYHDMAAAFAFFHLDVRRDMAAADELAKLGPEALATVTDTLREQVWDWEIAAIRASGKFHDPAVIPALAQCLRDENRHPVQFPRGYSTSGPPRIGFVLCFFCVQSMAEIGPEAVAPLIKLLDDPDDSVRYVAARALGKLKDKRATEALALRLKDDEESVRSAAARALGDIGDPKAIPALSEAIKCDRRFDNCEYNGRVSAAGALARMGQEEGLHRLLAMLTPNPVNIYEQLQTIQELGTPQIKGTLDPLLSLLGDDSIFVRRSAAEAIGNLHDPRAIPAVTKLLNDSDLYVRLAAMDALGEIHDPSALPALRKLRNDPERQVRQSAADTLEKLGDKRPPTSKPGRP